ncbi:unnamed protein product [Meganyctiphanes norvegica]|uniref:Uncharacterized protein n=1 Tax=Meganyctiphanes norvegica TaxID=48144 RepID=A0AAV2R6X1_MEGNR
MFKYLCFALLLTQVYAEEVDLNPQNQIYIISGILGGVCLILTIISIINTLNLISLKSELKKLKVTAPSSKAGIVNNGMAPLNEGPRRDSVELHQKSGGVASRDPYLAYDNRPAQGPSRDPYAQGRYNSSAPPRDQYSRQPSRPVSRPVVRAPSNADYY